MGNGSSYGTYQNAKTRPAKEEFINYSTFGSSASLVVRSREQGARG
jgi:hypothetical protein